MTELNDGKNIVDLVVRSRIKELEGKSEVVTTLLREFEDRIALQTSFSPDEAVEYGGMYVTYNIDLAAYSEEVERLRGKQSEAEKSQRQKRDAQGVIMHAQEGRYSPMKSYLEKIAAWELQLADVLVPLGATDSEVARQRRLANNYFLIAETISDQGKPFVPPQQIT